MNVTGFDSIAREKTLRLVAVLERVASHPYLKNNVCLHGGTALNLFIINLPRLSLDADFNYVGSLDRAEMYKAKPLIRQALREIADEARYNLVSGNEEHSGTTYKLLYTSSATGRADFIKIDIDYLNRATLLPIQNRTPVYPEKSSARIPLNASIEIAAGKIKALLERTVPRDLYDVGSLRRTCLHTQRGTAILIVRSCCITGLCRLPFPGLLLFRTGLRVGRET